MTSYTSFYGGTATVAGALVGLLFVALSVSPERLRGATASVEHQAVAATAFTALVDALFVSLIGLQPGGGVRVGAVIFGGLGLTSTWGLARRLWRVRGTAQLSLRWPYLLSVIIVVYAAQLVTGLTVSGASEDDLTSAFIYTMFGIGISRSWELLGLPGGGLLDLLTERLTRREAVPGQQPPEDPPGMAGGTSRLRGERNPRAGRTGARPLTMAWTTGSFTGARMPVTASADSARNAILTVDDDPDVSRAVARDLRRRYGSRYRIVRAESGESALEALREMKLRGEQVAVILADYRMPQMNGIEFLERAMGIYPGARRVLLTAYADTGAAIDAINVVDLDHYLLKPWDPPEEKLYPVVDALLDAWLASDHRPVPETKVIGHRWSARSSEVREFLARNQVPYRWYSTDEPEGERLLAAAGQDGLRLPVVATPDGGVLVAPPDAELAGRVGLATTPSAAFYDLIVIGGGPAGLAAAVYGASEGLRTVLVERTATGGQAGQSSRIENYLGFPDGVSGAQLTDRARRQAARFGAELLTTREVTGLEINGSARTVRFSDGTAIDAHSVVLATGVSYRQLAAPGLGKLTGCGVYYGSALTEAAGCQGHDVYVVGGANSAGQAAIYLAREAASVTLVVRGPSLTRSMSYYLTERISGMPAISVRTCTEVVRASGDGHLERLRLRDARTGGVEDVEAQWLFVFIGAEPRTGWLDGVVMRDGRGFILAGPDLAAAGKRPPGWPLDRPPYHLETSVPGVFAAGDVRAESAKRVASAVGEGAMAVMLVHRYLEKLLPGEDRDR